MRGPPYPDTVPDRSIFRGTDFRIIEIPDKRSSIIDGPPNISSVWIQTSGPPSDPPPSARNLSFHRFHSWREEGKYTKWCGNDENSIMESLSYDIIIARVAHDAKVSWKNFFLRISASSSSSFLILKSPASDEDYSYSSINFSQLK